MTRRFCLWGPVAALVSVSAAARAQEVKSDQQILIALERQWDAAFHKGDAKFIESLLADEFIATYGDGSRGDKAKEVSLARDQRQQVDSRRLDEFIVKTFGNTAVVWFTQILVGPVNGKPTEIRYRYVDVWVNRGGRWLAVASQSTRLNAKE
jgi:ketosteroid isomerase-like protein